jgi:small conductance mechanosensitive channel
MFSGILESIVIPAALRIVLAILVWLVGRWLAKRGRTLVEKAVRRTELSESFVILIVTLSYYGMLLLVVLAALGILGVPTTTLVGAVGAVAVVLAIALQTSLANLAATVIILLFKPFEMGDLIETGGVLGGVREIQMFNSVLASPDGKTHIVPNGKIQAAGLTNLSKTGRLRLDLRFQVSYDSNLEKAKQILVELLATDERVLAEPPAHVFVRQLADSGIELVVWPFVKIQDFETFQLDFVERVKNAFDAKGITVPFPQQDVHVYSHN